MTEEKERYIRIRKKANKIIQGLPCSEAVTELKAITGSCVVVIVIMLFMKKFQK